MNLKENISQGAQELLRKNLVLKNSMTRVDEHFQPISPDGVVGMYSCGPTVYKDAHIGNHRANVFADTLRRTLLLAGYDVKHVINITDVGHLVSDGDDGEDKLMKQAVAENKTAWEVAGIYTQRWLADLVALNILMPDVLCKATDHIKEQIELVSTLEQKGFTYRTNDGIYFDTSKLDDYGTLSDLDFEHLKAGSRVEMGEKRNSTDFALWKFSRENEKRDMEWTSPWGLGFPGWHIECSAMAMKYLGPQFDVHTGGVDLQQTHHPNEIAQSEAATGQAPFVKHWMHSGHVNLLTPDEHGVMRPTKMSKSLGNVITIESLKEQKIDPLALRLMYLKAKYNSPLEVSEESLQNVQREYESLRKKVRKSVSTDIPDMEQALSTRAQELEMQFIAALASGLNTPVVLSILWTILEEDEKLVTSREKYRLVKAIDTILAIDLLEFEQKEESFEIPEHIYAMAEARAEKKREKNWAAADELRQQILSAGYVISDTSTGFTITKRS